MGEVKGNDPKNKVGIFPCHGQGGNQVIILHYVFQHGLIFNIQIMEDSALVEIF